jgi:hypothetical protein
MEKVIKKYVTWTLIGFVMSFSMVGLITLQAAPTYELNGNEKVKNITVNYLKKLRVFFP